MSGAIDAKLLPEPPLLVLPSLAAAIGLNEAVALQQVHFKTRESDLAWWPDDTGQLRATFPFWSWPTIRRTLAGLEQRGLVKVRQDGRDRTKRYRLQIDALDRLNLSPKRGDASAQVGAVLSLKPQRRGNGGDGRRARARFDQGKDGDGTRFDRVFEEPAS